MADDPLFRIAHDALTFAFAYAGQQFDRSLMLKVASPSAGIGKGLSGLDGAAQAGMIRREVAALGKVAEAVLMARFAPKTVPCSCGSPCCRKYRDNPEYANAIAVLADNMRRTALAGTSANAITRTACVIRYFTPESKRISYEDLAKLCSIHRQSASAYASRVAGVLLQYDKAAVAVIETNLQAAGVVGE
ncbi:MAG: hypothetical protein H6R01_444 [Burkholderiaceae bacterium]|nr:hypothetical protein [Burkholderiaceae bacterium]